MAPKQKDKAMGRSIPFDLVNGIALLITLASLAMTALVMSPA